MSEKRDAHIKNIDEIQAVDFRRGAIFGGLRKRLAAVAGGKAIGCSWIELPPGRRAFPHHYHFGNEEAFFILSGSGEVRLGEARYPVSAGDYVACPPGPETAHSIANTGAEALRYLAFSTANGTDVVVYPDSQKFGVSGGGDIHKGLMSAPFGKVLKEQPSVDYYLDEE